MKTRRFFSFWVALTLCPAVYAAASDQQMFSTPKEAVQAVINACKNEDGAALLKIFGPDGKDIVESGDPSDDKDSRAMFVKAAEKKYKLIPDPMTKEKIILSIGKDDWPFPIPLIRKEGKWFFDSVAGRQEILARRIGSNELNAIEVAHAYVEAQFEYAQTHKKDRVPVYAQKIVSSPGQQDVVFIGNLRRMFRNARFPKVSLTPPWECRWRSVSLTEAITSGS